MNTRALHLNELLYKSKTIRIILHVIFWTMVAGFYFMLFSWNSEFREITFIFSTGLLPVAIVEAYFFNYLLVPKYLWKRKYGRFLLFSFYTLLVAIWISFMVVFFTLIFILNTKRYVAPSVLHPEWQVITVNFIVFLAIAIKQVKRTFHMQQEKSELEKTKLTTELKLKEAELKLLKAQIHPHFLFNTLNNLYGLTLEKSDEAPALVLQLSEILDYILYRCDEKRVMLSEELNNLKNYLNIERIRYSEKLKLKITLPDKMGQLKIAPLIILPFVENAFKHGVSHFPGIAFVNLNIQLLGKNLVFDIENSKNQIIKANSTKGIGLINVRKRLDLTYPGKYILSIDDRAETFSVNLTLELEE